ncbi:phosphatidylglycerophosphate synthase [Bacillus sp. V3-13]|uniref:CDP-alcohol phosphatidyltransferase family protein n=1 Tax=Bacillus sp. V3-13 TaxID=2053728 RepID=UPI000C780A03|nr:CDP-alcohol phosphatidyltransferase family protein [Bacillus sp. V3-13]PLR75975.1 phosphatidylglycerophosphate synthase [Bacillus sp. V3-13]
MKVIPNWISFSRIVLSMILIFIKPLSLAFYVIYITCGFSDMIDGFIARKTGTTSRLGEKLDSLADMMMAGVLLVVLFPIVNPANEIIIWAISIGIIRLSSMVVAMKKYKTFVSIHTYGNKITGLVLFIFPILIAYINTDLLMYIICVVASISAIEELIIQVTSNELQVNRQSLFVKRA